eukprot:scaffold314436_cov22-Tisochrysis_lutea.AAC.1
MSSCEFCGSKGRDRQVFQNRQAASTLTDRTGKHTELEASARNTAGDYTDHARGSSKHDRWAASMTGG